MLNKGKIYNFFVSRSSNGKHQCYFLMCKENVLKNLGRALDKLSKNLVESVKV
jgi:hypothetical protein